MIMYSQNGHDPAHSRQATFSVYRTPSEKDAANTAAALSVHACSLHFLGPAEVIQTSPGIYEVCVSYGPDVAGSEYRELQRVIRGGGTVSELAPVRA